MSLELRWIRTLRASGALKESCPLWKTSRDSLSQGNLQLDIESHLASLSKPILNFVTKDNPGHEIYSNTQTPVRVGEEACKFISRVTEHPHRPPRFPS